MHKTTLPEYLRHIKGLFWSETSENLSGQMSVAAAIAGPKQRKSFSRKSNSKIRIENKNWYEAAQKIATLFGIAGQIKMADFQIIVDKYPEKRVVIYLKQTMEPSPNGHFIGDSYNQELSDLNSIFILYDSSHDHFTFIQNMQTFFRSFRSFRDHIFCTKCLGWLGKYKFNTHKCVYEFRCKDCGCYHFSSYAELQNHRNQNIWGKFSCDKCGDDMAGESCFNNHVKWCESKSLKWIKCTVCKIKYGSSWSHKCYHFWCKKCSIHYPKSETHRCFLCPDKYRRYTEGVSDDGESISESDFEISSDLEIVLLTEYRTNP
jgi:hypothetical protein